MRTKTLWGHKWPSTYTTGRGGECSNCGAPLDRKGRYCKACHAEYNRLYRAKKRAELARLREKAGEA